MDLETGLPQLAIESDPKPEINVEEVDPLLNELDRRRVYAWQSSETMGHNNHRNNKKCYIFKFDGPEDLHKVRVVAIGPYHHERQVRGELLVTTEMKWQIVTYLDKRHKFNWKSCAAGIKLREMELRSVYEGGKFEMDTNAFIEMLLLDGCFLIFVFMIFRAGLFASFMLDINLKRNESDPPTGMEKFGPTIDILARKLKEIKLDLLMYDNQVPFCLISQKSFENNNEFKRIRHVKVEHKFPPLKIKHVLEFFDDIYPPIDPEYIQTIDEKAFHHLLHLFHWSRTASTRYKSTFFLSNFESGSIPCALELQESGISFYKKNHSAYDIMFSHGLWGAFKLKGIMNVPKLHITDYTKYILHTLVIFEQHQQKNRGFCITSYVASMEQLVQSEKDVKLLRRSGILPNTSKTNKEVVEIIQGLDLNQLSVETMPMLNISLPYTLYSVFYNVRSHHGRKWNMRYREFEQNYCSNIWITLSVIAAILLFFFTGLQSTYAVLSYHFPKH